MTSAVQALPTLTPADLADVSESIPNPANSGPDVGLCKRCKAPHFRLFGRPLVRPSSRRHALATQHELGASLNYPSVFLAHVTEPRIPGLRLRRMAHITVNACMRISQDTLNAPAHQRLPSPPSAYRKRERSYLERERQRDSYTLCRKLVGCWVPFDHVGSPDEAYPLPAVRRLRSWRTPGAAADMLVVRSR